MEHLSAVRRRPLAALGTGLFLALALCLALSVRPAGALELTADEVSAPSLSLSLSQRDCVEDVGGLSALLTQDCYYLLLDGHVLVTADTEEALTGLVQAAVETYITEDTISVSLADAEQLQLCQGTVSLWEPADLAAAADTLAQELNVVTVEQTVREIVVHYSTVQAEDDTMYEDEDPVVTEGSDGLKEVTTQTTCLNGEAQETVTVDIEITVKPVDEVITVGTKERPEYIWPAVGRISSHFGRRHVAGGSSNHKGIDIAASYGSDIVAAKAGTVIYAQWNSGGYGYLVKIDHGDGTVTYYAHNSSLCVSVGDEVEQGDVIAKAGSTGNSTGTHCHFEIRIDGVPVDPEDYLE
ncbi:MAG: peptidoglycan DD-metalloendopeptidase family protein [Clostridiales bacterium]|nr:peptidoglycan DD-metalloendopeptidase family protein [Clostridiales bacterium]